MSKGTLKIDVNVDGSINVDVHGSKGECKNQIDELTTMLASVAQTDGDVNLRDEFHAEDRVAQVQTN